MQCGRNAIAQQALEAGGSVGSLSSDVLGSDGAPGVDVPWLNGGVCAKDSQVLGILIGADACAAKNI